MKSLLLYCVFLLFTVNLTFASSSNYYQNKIIPYPSWIEVGSDSFNVTASTKVLIENRDNNSKLKEVGNYLLDLINRPSGYQLSLTEIDISNQKQPTNSILLSLKKKNKKKGKKGKKYVDNDEGYELIISKDRVAIYASQAAGIFYGIQTLRQLFPPQIEQKSVVNTKSVLWSLPSIHIKDWPRFKWRGMHFDVSRHFFPKEFIKRYLDLLAMHKINVFHWHLTDDQGWRLEIKQYPKLIEIGSLREEKNGNIYGGFYSQNDVKEIIDYANSLFITILPEIEMPGHTQALVASYPHLSCNINNNSNNNNNNNQVPVWNDWGISNEVICPGKDSTFTFLENILEEVTTLFPGNLIHIGGDECLKDHWKICLHCQERMKREGIDDEEKLQSYFVKRIEGILNSKNRTLVGWDEILDGGLVANTTVANTTVMVWRDLSKVKDVVSKGNNAVVSYARKLYFNLKEDNSPSAPGHSGYLSLKTVYDFNPMPSGLSKIEESRVVGAQGQLWTEYVTSASEAEFLLLPRLSALAEMVWSDQNLRDWNNFKTRLPNLIEHFKIMELNYNRNSL
ncbi:MAG: beta-N-acetylhexosaminidase [Oligoflexia bacterium]|nr:beta-N-acetylhexosaminidase [Oligoflexia bacterium]